MRASDQLCGQVFATPAGKMLLDLWRASGIAAEREVAEFLDAAVARERRKWAAPAPEPEPPGGVSAAVIEALRHHCS